MDHFNLKKYDAIVVGAGLTGATIARYLSDNNKKVLVVDRRNHIAGNLYDYVNETGILVQKYGPHTFHTSDKSLFEFVSKYEKWKEYELKCGAEIDGITTPTPFNYSTIDSFFDEAKAFELKRTLNSYYPNRETVPVVELLKHENNLIREYANFLWNKDYSLYTAKQWGISPNLIDKSVLKRVPIRLSYKEGYFNDIYQVMPEVSFTDFIKNLLSGQNIDIVLNKNGLSLIRIDEDNMTVKIEEESFDGLIIYTGAIDELFNYKYGRLPYRSLKFQWKTLNKSSFQKYPVVAYPQDKEYTRITEYTKLPFQFKQNLTCIAVEYSLPDGDNNEPYYPVLSESSIALYQKYKEHADAFKKLYVCGRLGEFKYYNMDQALKKALDICRELNL